MTHTFTPGPWRWHLGRGANPRLHIQTSGGYQIASTPKVNKHETREDDARLIAAAPDLLAALHQLDTWLHSGITVDGKAPEIAQQWTRAAISRATGAV